MPENIENENDSRRQRRLQEREVAFARLANSRVNIVLEGLRKLGNLSNKGNYEYSREDIEDIFSVIERETKRVKRLFEADDSNNQTFNLTWSRTNREERNARGNKS